MSQYMSLYIKSNRGEFVPIGTFSRSNSRYQALQDHVQYGRNMPLTIDTIDTVIKELKECQQHNKTMIDKANERIAIIKSFDNSVEEKIEALDDTLETLEDMRECVAEADATLAYYEFLRDLVEEVAYQPYSDPARNYDPNAYLWVSWEAEEDINKDFFPKND